MPDQIYTVEIDGKHYDLSGDHPPTEAEARAAIGPTGDHYTGPDTFMGGALQSLGDTAKRAGSAFLQNAEAVVDPRTYLNAARAKASAEDQAVADVKAGRPSKLETHAPLSETLQNLTTPEGGGGALGQLVTGAVVAPWVAGKAAGVLRTVAPKVMDMGLQRTMADRLDFPNTPKRLVDDGIVPRGTNVQDALSAAEGRVSGSAAAFDQAHQIGPINPDDIANAAQGQAYTAGKIGGLGNVPGPEDAELGALKQQYLNQNTRSRGLAETIDQKRAYQARSKYSSRPNSPTVTDNALNFNGGVADANRQMAITMEPSIGPELAREQDLLGAQTALDKMNAKSTPLSTVGTIKTGLFLRNPTAMGGAAIGMDRLGRALQLSPAAIRLAILARMQGQPSEPTR